MGDVGLRTDAAEVAVRLAAATVPQPVDDDRALSGGGLLCGVVIAGPGVKVPEVVTEAQAVQVQGHGAAPPDERPVRSDEMPSDLVGRAVTGARKQGTIGVLDGEGHRDC